MNNTFPSLPNLNDINSVLKFYNYDWTINLANIRSYKENKGFIKIRKKIPLIYWTK